MAILLENASVVTLNVSKPVLEAQQILIHEETIAGWDERFTRAGFQSQDGSTARK